MGETYGSRRVPRLLQKVKRHRELINNEGSPALQDSWGEIENFIDYFYGEIGKEDSAKVPTDMQS